MSTGVRSNPARAVGALLFVALAAAGCGESMTLPEFRSPVVFRSEDSPPARTVPSGSRATVSVAYVGDQPTNLREGPGTRYRVIGVAPPGTRLEVLGTEADWLEIRHGDSTAWLAEHLTRPGSAAATAAPSSPPAPEAAGSESAEPQREAGEVLPNF